MVKDAHPEAEPARSIGAEAPKLTEEQQLHAALRTLRAVMASVSSNPQLTREQKANILAQLDDMVTASADAINRAVAEVMSDLPAAAAETSSEVSNDVHMALEALEEYEEEKAYLAASSLNEHEQHRAMEMSRRIDVHDEKSVERFAETLIGEDVPKVVRQQAVEDTARLIKDPIMAETVAMHNAASPMAKAIVNAEHEKTSSAIHTMANSTPKTKAGIELKTQAEHAEKLGSTASPEVVKIAVDLKAGTLSHEEGGKKLKHENEKQHARVAEEMHSVIPLLPKSVRDSLGDLRNTDAIIDGAMATFSKLKEKPNYHPTDIENAQVRALIMTRSKTTLDTLAHSEHAIDLELHHGTPKERIAKAAEILAKSPAFAGMPTKQREEFAKQAIENLDDHKVSLKQYSSQNATKQNTMVEAVASDEYKVFIAETTEAAHAFKDGLNGFKNGDGVAAGIAAHKVGMAVTKALVAHVGVSAANAQAVGERATKILTALGGVAVAPMEMVHGVENFWNKMANASAAAVQLTQEQQAAAIAKKESALAKAKLGGHVDTKTHEFVSADGKQHLKLTGDAAKDLSAITATFTSNGVAVKDMDPKAPSSAQQAVAANAKPVDLPRALIR